MTTSKLLKVAEGKIAAALDHGWLRGRAVLRDDIEHALEEWARVRPGDMYTSQEVKSVMLSLLRELTKAHS